MAASLRRVTLFFGLVLASAPATEAPARTFLLPHFIETSASPGTPYSFDTFVQLTYVPGLVDLEAAPGATADVYLFNNNGTLLLSASASQVCNPCSFALSAFQRRSSVSLQNLIEVAGGFASGVAIGFALIEVSGDDGNVVVGATTTNTHASASDLDVLVHTVAELPGGLSQTGRLIVYPHFSETSTSTSTSQYAFDTVFYAAYAGGITGSPIPAGSGANVALWLFKDNGTPTQSLVANDVCAPCAATVSAATPKATFSLQALFTAAGGFASAVETGFALMVITGSADAVASEAFLINSHTSALDLSMDELEATELPYAQPPTAVATPPAGAALRGFPNPLQGSSRIDYTVDREGQVSIEIIDVRGRVVARPVDQRHDAGTYQVEWDGRSAGGEQLASGVYFARLTSADGTRVVKLTIVR